MQAHAVFVTCRRAGQFFFNLRSPPSIVTYFSSVLVSLDWNWESNRFAIKLKRIAMIVKSPKQISWIATPILKRRRIRKVMPMQNLGTYWAIVLPVFALDCASGLVGFTVVTFTAPTSWRSKATVKGLFRKRLLKFNSLGKLTNIRCDEDWRDKTWRNPEQLDRSRFARNNMEYDPALFWV